jgi:translation initiation factor 3 subunit C
MASNFRFDSDSEADDVSEHTRSDVSSPVPQDDDGPRQYWFEFTEEEDEEEVREVLSKEQRSANEIFAVFDKYDWSVTNSDFAEAQKHFVDIVAKAKVHVEKFDIRKIVDLNEATTEDEDQVRSLWGILQESVAEDEMIEQGLRRSDDEDAAAKPGYNRLVKLQEERMKFRAYLEALKVQAKTAIALAEEEEEGEVTESVLLGRLEDAWLGKRKDKKVNGAQSCAAIVKTAADLKFTDVTVTAEAVHALLSIKEESRRVVSIPCATLVRHFDKLVSLIKPILSRKDVVDSFDALKERSSTDAPEGDVQFRSGIVIPGGIVSVCTTLFSVLRSSLVFTKIYEVDYKTLLVKENELSDFIDQCFSYTNSKSGKISLAKNLLSVVGQRSEVAHKALFALLSATDRPRSLLAADITTTVKNLTNILVNDNISVLYNVYQLALQGKFQEGKDVILRSGISEEREYSYWNDEFSMMYNRVIAQLGLAAFAAAKFQEASECLQKLFVSGYDQKMAERVRSRDEVRTSIGQEAPRTDDSNAQLAWRDLLVPAHFEILYDHLELAASVSEVILDAVADARRPYQHKKRSIIARQIKFPKYQHNVSGSPNNTTEMLRAVVVALKNGEGKQITALIRDARAWDCFPQYNTTPRDNVIARIREEALKVYCYTYAVSFSSLSVADLATQFELTADSVRCIINQALLDKESPLVAFWSQDEELLLVDRGNVTRLQHLVNDAADKVYELAGIASGQSRGRGGRGGRGRGRRN